jgi:hypothetical protein
VLIATSMSAAWWLQGIDVEPTVDFEVISSQLLGYR